MSSHNSLIFIDLQILAKPKVKVRKLTRLAADRVTNRGAGEESWVIRKSMAGFNLKFTIMLHLYTVETVSLQKETHG